MELATHSVTTQVVGRNWPEPAGQQVRSHGRELRRWALIMRFSQNGASYTLDQHARAGAPKGVSCDAFRHAHSENPIIVVIIHSTIYARSRVERIGKMLKKLNFGFVRLAAVLFVGFFKPDISLRPPTGPRKSKLRRPQIFRQCIYVYSPGKSGSNTKKKNFIKWNTYTNETQSISVNNSVNEVYLKCN